MYIWICISINIYIIYIFLCLYTKRPHTSCFFHLQSLALGKLQFFPNVTQRPASSWKAIRLHPYINQTPKHAQVLLVNIVFFEGEDFPTRRHKFHLSSVKHHKPHGVHGLLLRKNGVGKRSPRSRAKSSVFSWSWRMHQEKWLHLCCFKASAMHPGICLWVRKTTHLKDATKNPAVDSACFQCILYIA